jgi:NhaP-type Na+/H+ and K+/H+ antiporter
VKKVDNMGRVGTWRSQLDYATLILTLTLFELVLSVAFLSVSYIWGSYYFKGVGVGLLISWVTSALAYLIVRRAKAASSPPPS